MSEHNELHLASRASAASAVRRIRGWKSSTITVLSHLILTAGLVTMIIPFFWMASTSLKTFGAAFSFPPQWIPSPPQWQNYSYVLGVMSFGRYFLNSTFIAIVATVGQLITCSMAAFAFARLRFPGREKIFLLYLATLMVPIHVTIIPLFILMKYLGWINTYQALVIPDLFSAFGTFLLRQFFKTIPTELEEAAIIDGCSFLKRYYIICLPLAKPALAALFIFTFMASWNNFLWPLIVTTQDAMRTLPVGLAAFQGLFFTKYHYLMAGSFISLIPILIVFVAAQKQFVKGITLTGLKG